jgi:hypothetical protein
MRAAYRASGLRAYFARKAELTHRSVYEFIRLGDTEGAIARLEKRLADRNPTMVWVKVHRQYDPLRSDPRFKDLLRRMALQ